MVHAFRSDSVNFVSWRLDALMMHFLSMQLESLQFWRVEFSIVDVWISTLMRV